ncbi:M12 family metallopeptidase [Haliangium sp.]|uniref:M12 family metallopeptidase n=1 Tax=Haliangium sp. TaxID=2663208 RepID=UPI003D135A4C
MSDDRERMLDTLTERLASLETRLAQLEGGGAAPPAAAAQAPTPVTAVCALPPVVERELGAGVSPMRARLIRTLSKKWVNGTVLHYYFFDRDTDGENVQRSDGSSVFRSWVGEEAQREVVRRAFTMWKDLGIGLSFVEVSDREDAEIRIGFMRGDGSWSYVGRDIIDQAPSVNERTMNFGWDLTRSGELDTALHEIGHTLGFPHEHQNPNAGIVWDEEAVYRALAQPPNSWSRQDTFYNIIRKLNPGEVEGSSWDPDSIMHYPFGPGLIKAPPQYARGLDPEPGLSARDIAMVKQFYPAQSVEYPTLQPFKAEMLDIAPGEQKNFSIEPQATRKYRLQTFGESDTVLVLFEEADGELNYRAGDDDSGVDRNANLHIKLVKGRRYVVRVRLYYSASSGQTALMMW